MDFNAGTHDPYQILGVPFGSSFDLCKATYKSLCKIYHPDVFDGDKKFAKSRMSELNAAIDFLGNPKNKEKFDKTDGSRNFDHSNFEYDENTKDKEYTRASQVLKEHWEFACEYHPNIQTLYNHLARVDGNTAFLFMAMIVENKLYDKAEDVADYLKINFLSSKFGNDAEIQRLAEYAILNKEFNFAKDLNRALKILGEGSKHQIFQKLSKNYPNFTSKAIKQLHFQDWLSTDPTGHYALNEAYENKRKVPNREIRNTYKNEFNAFKKNWEDEDPARKWLSKADAWHAFLGSKLF